MSNISIGRYAGYSNETGEDNVAIGIGAGESAVDGQGNTFLGQLAGSASTGSENVVVGREAGSKAGADPGGDNLNHPGRAIAEAGLHVLRIVGPHGKHVGKRGSVRSGIVGRGGSAVARCRNHHHRILSGILQG